MSEEGFMFYGLMFDGMMKVIDGNNFLFDYFVCLFCDIGMDLSEVIGNLFIDY